VLREWALARSAPASPLARACAVHLPCRVLAAAAYCTCATIAHVLRLLCYHTAYCV